MRELPEDGPGGWCDPKRKQIVVATGPRTAQVRTLVHEIAHALGLGYEHYGRERRGARRLRHLHRRARLGRPRRRRRVDPVHRGLGRRRRPGRDPRVRRRRSTRSRAASRTRSAPTRTSRRASDRREAGRVSEVSRSAGSLGRGCTAPMIGQPRPAPAAGRDRERRHAAGRPHPVGAHAAPDQPATCDRPRGDEDDLYRRHHRDLHRAVARAVTAPRELIEDACQPPGLPCCAASPSATRSSAGSTSSPSTRPTGSPRSSAATHGSNACPRGWRLAGRPRQTRRSLDDALDAREALRILASLPEPPARQTSRSASPASATTRSRELTGGRTFTNVNKHLAKARARVRLARLRAQRR